MKKYILLFVMYLSVTSCELFFKWQTKNADGFIEEIAEEIIEDAIDLPENSLDLTPFTGDERQNMDVFKRSI